MKTIIVHLPTATERYQHITRQLHLQAITDFEFTDAVIGESLTPPNRALGSLLTHIKVTEKIAALNIGPVLVLEDDTTLEHSFMPQLQRRLSHLTIDWDIAFIGYNTQGQNLWSTRLQHWRLKQKGALLTFSGGWAYVINGAESAAKIAALLKDESNPGYPFHDMMLKHLVNTEQITGAWLCFRLAKHGDMPSTIKHYQTDAKGNVLPQFIAEGKQKPTAQPGKNLRKQQPVSSAVPDKSDPPKQKPTAGTRKKKTSATANKKKAAKTNK